jgi:hypothetical protein
MLLSSQTKRYSRTSDCISDVIALVRAAGSADRDLVMQDAFDTRLAILDPDRDFPAVAIPVWTAFRSRYVSDVTGELYLGDEPNAVDDVIFEATEMLVEILSVMDTETSSHIDRDRLGH